MRGKERIHLHSEHFRVNPSSGVDPDVYFTPDIIKAMEGLIMVMSPPLMSVCRKYLCCNNSRIHYQSLTFWSEKGREVKIMKWSHRHNSSSGAKEDFLSLASINIELQLQQLNGIGQRSIVLVGGFWCCGIGRHFRTLVTLHLKLSVELYGIMLYDLKLKCQLNPSLASNGEARESP